MTKRFIEPPFSSNQKCKTIIGKTESMMAERPSSVADRLADRYQCRPMSTTAKSAENCPLAESFQAEQCIYSMLLSPRLEEKLESRDAGG